MSADGSAAASATLPSHPDIRRSVIAGAIAFTTIALATLYWSKWWPYAHKLPMVWDSGSYPGHSIFGSAGGAGDAPSLRAGWEFTRTYFEAIWQALVAGLVIAAAVDVFLPRRWLVGAVARGHGTDTLAAGLLGTTSMMCTCCSAPVAATMRRDGVPTSPALAFWLANPLLNPVALAFIAVVLPWQWFATRLLIGLALVFLVTRWLGRSDRPSRPPDFGPSEPTLVERAARYPRSLVRLCLTLLPEYLVVVFALGALRGWLFPFDGGSVDWNVLLVVLAAAVGTAMVIPTAGEIPILTGLAAAGAPAGALGALLITLPAISLPSMAMVSRAFSSRVVLATAGAVCAMGIAGGTLFWALGG